MVDSSVFKPGRGKHSRQYMDSHSRLVWEDCQRLVHMPYVSCQRKLMSLQHNGYRAQTCHGRRFQATVTIGNALLHSWSVCTLRVFLHRAGPLQRDCHARHQDLSTMYGNSLSENLFAIRHPRSRGHERRDCMHPNETNVGRRQFLIK